jgi:hypothetical protein
MRARRAAGAPQQRAQGRSGARAAVVGTIVTLLAPGCGRHATPAECAALLDRYVELLVREQDPKAPDTEIAQQKERTRAKAENEPAFASCPNEVSAKGARCAMSAVNVDEFEKCLE